MHAIQTRPITSENRKIEAVTQTLILSVLTRVFVVFTV